MSNVSSPMMVWAVVGRVYKKVSVSPDTGDEALTTFDGPTMLILRKRKAKGTVAFNEGHQLARQGRKLDRSEYLGVRQRLDDRADSR